MGDVVNLRRVRKAKARDAETRQAEANRVAFGRTKAERLAAASAQARADAQLDGHLIDGAAIAPTVEP